MRKSVVSEGVEHSFEGDHADLQAQGREEGIREVIVDVEGGDEEDAPVDGEHLQSLTRSDQSKREAKQDRVEDH